MRRFALTTGSQLVHALVSFAATLTLVRLLSPDNFGIYAAFAAVAFLIMAANRGIFGEQIIAGNIDVRGFTDVIGTLALIGATAGGLVGWWSGSPLLALASIHASATVATDAVRYELMAARVSHGVDRRMLIADGTRLVAGLLALGASTDDHLKVVSWSLLVLSSLVWPTVSGLFSRPPSPSRVIAFMRRAGRFEATMAVQFAVGTGAAQLLPFVAIATFGIAEYGGLRVAQSLAAPVALVATATTPAMIGLISGKRDPREQVVATARLLAVGLPVAGLLWATALLVLETAAGALVPPNQLVVVEGLLAPAIAAAALIVVGQPGGALIRVRRYAGVALSGQIVGVAIAWVLALTAVNSGLVAFAWALAIGSLATVSITYALLVWRLLRDRRSGREPS
ncbi:hypothetical protein LG315_10545 [Microbacterium marinum]|uniref:hypothetical protein n=1 Tax=Microbacterium marinum TaxID=421115 RepID=UPI00384BC51B